MKYFAAVLFVLILAVSFILSDLSPPGVSAQQDKLESVMDAEINETFTRPVVADVIIDGFTIAPIASETVLTGGVYFYGLRTQAEFTTNDIGIIKFSSIGNVHTCEQIIKDLSGRHDPVGTYSGINYNYIIGTEYEAKRDALISMIERCQHKDELGTARFYEIGNLRVFNDRTVIRA